MSTAGIPVLGSVTLSGATSIQRKERDYIIEHQIAGKDGGLVERVGSASTRWEIKGLLRETDADSQYQSILALLGTTSNLSIPTFGSGYFLAASGTIVFVESFGGNWIPGVGYPRYDYTLKLVSTGPQPAPSTPNLPVVIQLATDTSELGNRSVAQAALGANVSIGNVLVVVCAWGSLNSSVDDGGVTDNLGNIYTRKQINGSALGSPTFRTSLYTSPITVAGACTVTQAFTTHPTAELTFAIYECRIISATPTATAGSDAIGNLGYNLTLRTPPNVTFSAISAAYISPGVESNPLLTGGTVDIANHLDTVNALACGRNGTTWGITDQTHFLEGCASEASF